MADKKTIKFEIVTPERTVFKQEVVQVTVPTQSGEITVLPDHIPLVSILKPGVLEIKTANQETEIISVSGGFIEVLRDKIVILADTAERAQELDENIIAEARRRAEVSREEAMSQDNYDLSAVAARLEIEVARERALHKWRKLKNIK
ncbi:MAG: ATP synthase F1 subunit epsilon [Patescibacteria group bacterium]|nr:ATP synthase F1 subunit epsilon [Patescibacteria group bacterium]